MTMLTITKVDAHNNVLDRKVKAATQISEPVKYAIQRLEWAKPEVVAVRIRNAQGRVLAEAVR
jgi:hypothetical protein